MEVVLIILGAVIAFVGGILTTKYQFKLARKERREARQEIALRELSSQLMAIELGASRYASAMKAGDSAKASQVAAAYFPAAERFMNKWFGEQLRVDVLDETLRKAGDMLHGALVVTVLDDGAAWREPEYLQWAGAMAEYFQRSVHVFLRGGELNPKDWTPPMPRSG